MNQVWRARSGIVARGSARGRSGPGGENLAAGAWQRLEALPDSRSPQGRIYPLACLIAIAVCAFTAAGNDRFTAVGQWIGRASQADLARLRVPWDPMARRSRHRMRRRSVSAGPSGPASPGPGAAPARAGQPAVWQAALGRRARYRARHAAEQAKSLARGRLRAVAVRRPPASPPCRLHPGPSPRRRRAPRPPADHLEVDVKHNASSHFTELLEPLDLAARR